MRIVATTFFALSLFNIATQHAIAAECSSKSGASTIPLLELYTSEGCSSCPPADKWLSSLKQDSSQLIPLAFHVDYWNYIGWNDKFSSTEYTARQRKVAAFNSTGFVYTPQFVMNGRDFKGWDNSRLNQSITATHKLASRANLSLNAITQANGEITLTVNAQAVKASDIKHSDIFVAIYENKLVSKVNAGENNGRELKHDYVVREFFGAYQINNKNEFSKNFTIKPDLKSRSYQLENMGAVVFVQNSQNGEILQSLALRFCNS